LPGKAVALLGVACLLAVPALHPIRDGRSVSDTRFSRAMIPDDSDPEGPLPRFRFTWAGDFSEDLAPVGTEGRFGFIDTTGAYRIAPLFEYAGGFSGNRAPVLISGAWGYVDVTGAMAVPAVYDWAGAFREGLAPVAADGQYLFIDTAGTPAGPLRFSDARPYSGGYAAVRLGEGDYGAWGFVDRTGALIIPPLFDDVPGGFSEGLAVVKMEHERPFRAGFIDSSGGFAFDTLYDAAGDFHEGRAPVGRGEWRGNRFEGLWGYADTTGRPVTALTYAEAGPFQDGKALVRFPNGGGYALIGKDGAILRAFRADAELRRGPGSGMVTYKVRKLCGFLDPETGRAIPPAYSEAGEMKQGLARVRLPGLRERGWTYIGRDGRFLGGAADAEAR
jgi:hypothetical protein